MCNDVSINYFNLFSFETVNFQRTRNPKLFWVSAIAPMVSVIVGCLFAYFAHAEKHGIEIVSQILKSFLCFLVSCFNLLCPICFPLLYMFQVGHLKKGINPISIKDLNFESKYLPATIKAGLITGLVALAVSKLNYSYTSSVY